MAAFRCGRLSLLFGNIINLPEREVFCCLFYHMSHENVLLYMGGLDPKSPYFPYIRERNGNIAMHISRYLGVGFDPVARLSPPEGKHYIIPGKTIDTAQAALLQIEGGADFYGAMAPDLGMVGKSILHPTVSLEAPEFYSSAFARAVTDEGLVLPGVTAFGKEELSEAYRSLPPQHLYRLKAANESDGNGQYTLRDSASLRDILTRQTEESLRSEGAVIEPNLGNHRTVSAGIFRIGDDPFAFVASQQNDLAGGRDRYLGAKDVTVVRGGLEVLFGLMDQLGDPRSLAAGMAARFHELFLTHYPVTASRLSYDVLSGTSGGQEFSGITDVTARLGGTCPALILAAETLQKNQSAQAAVGHVQLNYTPASVMDEERGAAVFLDAPALRITAKIDRVL